MTTAYGGDLIAAFWRGEISLRRLRVLVQNLPARGAVYRAVHGHSWHDLEYLLAQLLDDVRRLQVDVYRAAGNTKARYGKPIKRPCEKPKAQLGDRDGRPVEDVVAYLDSLSATKGAPPL